MSLYSKDDQTEKPKVTASQAWTNLLVKQPEASENARKKKIKK